MEPKKGRSMMDEALAKVPPESQLEIVKTAHEHRIDKNEPAWVLVELAMEAVGGVEKIAQSLRESSAAVTQATVDQVKERRDWAKTEIDKMAEKAKSDVASALSGMLETEIRNAVGRLQNQSNRPLHKKWLIAMGVLVLLAFGLGGWGIWSFWQYAKKTGEAVAYSEITANGEFDHFMRCDKPGWKTQWVMVGKEEHLACYPHRDKAGNLSGWTIK